MPIKSSDFYHREIRGTYGLILKVCLTRMQSDNKRNYLQFPSKRLNLPPPILALSYLALILLLFIDFFLFHLSPQICVIYHFTL